MARPSKQVIRLRNMVRRMRLAVGYLYSDDRPCRVINHNTGKDLFVKQEDIRAMPKVAYKWGVFIAVLCKNEFGDRYMKADYIKVETQKRKKEVNLKNTTKAYQKMLKVREQISLKNKTTRKVIKVKTINLHQVIKMPRLNHQFILKSLNKCMAKC